MKKTITRVVSMAVVVAMVCIMFASCATILSGTYTGKADLFGLAGGEVSYKFVGSSVTVTATANVIGFEKTSTYKGKYTINDKDDGTQTITFKFESDDAEQYNGTVSFSQDKDAGTIKMGGVTYTKSK